ncbi:hypothetical protein STEG23_025734, partial [Scotinomys teguina]
YMYKRQKNNGQAVMRWQCLAKFPDITSLARVSPGYLLFMPSNARIADNLLSHLTLIVIMLIGIGFGSDLNLQMPTFGDVISMEYCGKMLPAVMWHSPSLGCESSCRLFPLIKMFFLFCNGKKDCSVLKHGGSIELNAKSDTFLHWFLVSPSKSEGRVTMAIKCELSNSGTNEHAKPDGEESMRLPNNRRTTGDRGKLP